MPVRLAVCLLGGREVALEPMKLALAVERLADGSLVGEPGAGLARLLERFAPGAAHLHDLGAVDQAAAAEHREVRLLLAPTRHRGGPLLRAAQLVELPAAVDHAAVDEARGNRRHLAGDGGQHGLVEQRQPFLDAALPDEAVTLLVDGEREQVGVAEAAADLGAVGRAGAAGLRVRHAESLQQAQVAALDAVALLEQPLRAGEPAARLGGVAAQRQDQPEPERAAHGALHRAVLGVRLVGPLEYGQVLELVAEQVGRGGQPLEILATQLTRGRQRGVSVLPGPLSERLAAPFDGGARHLPV